MGNRRKLPAARRPEGKSPAAGAADMRAAVRVTSSRVVQMEHLPPEVLARFNEVLPGSARELLDNSLAESTHRRAQQNHTLEANIALQRQMLDRQDAETRNAFKSDVLGQTFGFALSLCCVGAAVAIAWFKPEMWKVAAAIVAMPALTVGVKVVIDSRHFRKAKSGESQG